MFFFTEFRIKGSPLRKFVRNRRKGRRERNTFILQPFFIGTPAIEDHGLVYIDHRSVDTVTLVLLPWYPDPWEQEQEMTHYQFQLMQKQN